MLIRVLSSIAGDRFSYSPGEVVNFEDEAEAQRMVDAGHAVPVRGTLESAATEGGPEHATLQTAVRTHRTPKPEAQAAEPEDGGKGKGGKGKR